jgi:diaminohydroxyphosphoribosylaminopyrimidine deaminase/5-amino-6-(5-phosphoribosylamino)uracil reductase
MPLPKAHRSDRSTKLKKAMPQPATEHLPADPDARFMHRALALARATTGLASPNPQVGCVLVRDGEIFAEGAHLYDAFDHAEIVALRHAEQRRIEVSGATAYVTLEPCSHHGRTGPCADALIQAGVARVVAATADPNPLVAGRGIARMRAAGVEVAVGTRQQEARALNDGFAKFIRTRRPLVTLKAALSVDGMLAPPASLRTKTEPHWLTGPDARAEVHRMRHAADAILTGIGTVLADDPLLTDRSGLPRRRPLLRVILDSQLRLPIASELAQSAASESGVLVFCAHDADPSRASALEAAGVELVRVAGIDGRLDLAAVLDELGARQILSLMLECGSRLNGAFLAQGLVDKLALFYAETELGAGAIPFAEGIGSPFLLEQSMRGITRTPFGADVLVSGTLRDPWASDTLQQIS